MRPRAPAFLGTAVFLVACVGLAAAVPQAVAAPDERGPKRVDVGFYVYNVKDLDIKNRSFTLDFYMWMWHDAQGTEEEKREYEQLDFPNGKIDHLEEQDRQTVEGRTYVVSKVTATFHQNFPLRDYPFDAQVLEIELEHPNFETHSLVYAHDEKSYERALAPRERWGIRNGLTIPEWRVVGTTRDVREYVYETDFGLPTTRMIGSKYSRLTLGIKIQRISAPYFYKIVIPLAVMLGVAYLAFFIPPHEITAAVTVALFALIGVVVFHTTVSANIPEVGYLVVSDKFFIATIALIFLNLAQSVATYNLSRKGKDEAAYRLEVACRVIFPIVYAATFAFLFVMTLLK